MMRCRRTMLLLVALLSALFAASQGRDKADLYFLQATVRDCETASPSSYRLLERAWELYPDTASEVAVGIIFPRLRVANRANDTVAFAQTLHLANRVAAKRPTDAYFADALARLYMSLGQPQKALPLVARVDSLTPGALSAKVRHADVLTSLHRYDEAIDIYRRAERTHGSSADLSLRIVSVLLNAHADTLAAIQEVERLVQLMPVDEDAMMVAATVYRLAGRTDLMLNHINRAVELAPSVQEVRMLQLEILKEVVGPEVVIDSLISMTRSDDLDASAKLDIISAYGNKHGLNLNNAKRVYDAYLAQYPSDEMVLHMLSTIYAGEHEYATAQKLLRRAIKENPNSGSLQADYIRILILDDKFKPAIEYGRQVLNNCELSNPDDVRYILSGAYMMQEQYADALEQLQLCLDEREELFDDEYRAQIYASMGDAAQHCQPDSVAAYYDKSLALNPNAVMTKNNYAYFLACRGEDLQRAETLINEVLFDNPTSATYLDTAAWVAYKLGKYSVARTYIDEALKQAGEDIDSKELMEHKNAIYEKSK